ncbi:MAG TPA: Gfo/Idh/MocA family oxidoreductase [Gaiellaceae bacterium]|jgi:predicted dehydrogenase
MLRIAILGAGWIAADHVAVLRGREDVEVVAVCDVDRERAAGLADSAAVYERWQDVLARERPDAIWVCLPPLAHREPTLAALADDVHVYLEKPIARTVDDARAIVEAASASGAVCAVGYQWHATEVLDDLRTAVEGQEVSLYVGRSIGPTGTRPWFLDRSQGGGNVLERGSHHIDLARTIAGEVVRVQAAPSTVLLGQAEGAPGDIEDAATLLLQHENGALSTIVVAWTRSGQPGVYGADVVATEATLHLALDPEFALDGISRGERVHARSSTRPFERSIDRFLAAVAEDDPGRVFCTPADAIATLAAANACERALATGETVAVEPPR